MFVACSSCQLFPIRRMLQVTVATSLTAFTKTKITNKKSQFLTCVYLLEKRESFFFFLKGESFEVGRGKLLYRAVSNTLRFAINLFSFSLYFGERKRHCLIAHCNAVDSTPRFAAPQVQAHNVFLCPLRYDI